MIACAMVVAALAPLRAAEPSVVLLWPNGAPGSEGKTGEETVRVTDAGEHVISNIHRPSLTVYLPAQENPTGAAVIVVPGGGHREIWMDHEGHNVARWLNEHGLAAFIVKYRLAHASGSNYTITTHELADVQRAIRLVRQRAAEWHIDPARLGVMGFSAGGELAALASLRFDLGRADAPDPIDRQGSRPAFQVLVYPGGAGNLVPTHDSPPAFLLAGNQDSAVHPEELAALYVRFKKAGVPAELHIYSDAGHGFGVRSTNRGPVAGWMDRFYEWLGARGFLQSRDDRH